MILPSIIEAPQNLPKKTTTQHHTNPVLS